MSARNLPLPDIIQELYSVGCRYLSLARSLENPHKWRLLSQYLKYSKGRSIHLSRSIYLELTSEGIELVETEGVILAFTHGILL